MASRAELVPGAQVHAERARMQERGARETEVQRLCPGLPEHRGDRPAGGPAHHGVIDHGHARPSHHRGNRRQFVPNGALPRSLSADEEGADGRGLPHETYTDRDTQDPGVASGGRGARGGDPHDDVDGRRGLPRQCLAQVDPPLVDGRRTREHGAAVGKVDRLQQAEGSPRRARRSHDLLIPAQAEHFSWPHLPKWSHGICSVVVRSRFAGHDPASVPGRPHEERADAMRVACRDELVIATDNHAVGAVDMLRKRGHPRGQAPLPCLDQRHEQRRVGAASRRYAHAGKQSFSGALQPHFAIVSQREAPLATPAEKRLNGIVRADGRVANVPHRDRAIGRRVRETLANEPQGRRKDDLAAMKHGQPAALLPSMLQGEEQLASALPRSSPLDHADDAAHPLVVARPVLRRA